MSAILGISAYYHDPAAVLCRTEKLSSAPRRSASPAASMTATFQKRHSLLSRLHAHTRSRDRSGGILRQALEETRARAVGGAAIRRPGEHDDRLASQQLCWSQVADRRRSGGNSRVGVHVEYSTSSVACCIGVLHFAVRPRGDPHCRWGRRVGDDRALWGTPTRIEQLKEICYPHSLGLFYATMTAYLGFEVNEGEYKVMGLASSGEPT